MNRRWPQLGLPLLTKELIEQAARRRTYFVRMLYAAMLFLLAFWQFSAILSDSGSNGLAMLGTGADMFHSVIRLQFLGILLFLPALTCSAITAEKEHNSLTVLLVTRLGPLTILLEKLLGRLVPMFSFLLLSLPLLAFAYSLGGVSTLELLSGIVMLVLVCFHLAALAVMCSTWCSSTASAFVGTYTLALLGYPVLVIATRLLLEHFATNTAAGIGFGTPAGTAVEIAPGFAFSRFATPIQLITENPARIWIQGVVLGLPALVYILMARVFLVSRSQVIRRNFVLRFFRQLDRFFFWINEFTTGGVILLRDDVRLPEDRPITWRETQKKTLGTARYLVRVLVSIETPLFLILAVVAGMAFQTRLGVAAEALYIVWALAVMLIIVHATSLFTSERSHQTLDLLLASSMTSKEIILQKHRSVRRVMYVMTVPLVTIFLFECWFAEGTPGLEKGLYAVVTVPPAALQAAFVRYDYFICSLLSAVIYLPLCGWIALWIGIKSKSQVRAMLLTLLLLFGWAFLPVLVAASQTDELVYLLLKNPPLAVAACLSSPSVIVLINQNAAAVNLTSPTDQLLYTAANFIAYGLAWYGLRHWCLAHSDQLLGRLAPNTTTPSPAPMRPPLQSAKPPDPDDLT